MTEAKPYQNRIEILQGTLDLLILQTLARTTQHGHGISQAIRGRSRDVLSVETGSLYPALHRLVKQRFIAAKDGLSENNRKAKYYNLTAKGRQHLTAENSKWDRLAQAIARIMRPTVEEGRP